MFLKLEFSVWTTHLNQLIYGYFYFCKAEKLIVNISFNEKVKHNGAILTINNKSIFFDYSDDTIFINDPSIFDFYFKRSLLESNRTDNIHPLNFNVPLTYKCHSLLFNLSVDIFSYKPNREQIIKAIDKWGLFTKSSHGVLDIRNYPKNIQDCGGNVLYQTRLWNPDNHPDEFEKKRRKLQNEFRINACRIIKKNFKNSSVGLVADDFSQKMAPDLVLNSSDSKRGNYFNTLKNTDIGIADDGLKDTPGWKIGEYLLSGKAVISTPLNIVVDEFQEHINYERLSSRNSYEEIPDKINHLLKNKNYLELGQHNFDWSSKYIHPRNYLKRILAVVEKNI